MITRNSLKVNKMGRREEEGGEGGGERGRAMLIGEKR